MSLIDIILLAVALGIDCMVVSFSQGLIFNKNRTINSLRLATTMGLFQGLMPVIGFVGIDYVRSIVAPFSKWIVFAIFFALGLKFILESLQEKEKKICCIGIKCLISFGIATSIDALVAGASLNLTNTPLAVSGLIIGVISFLMSMCGFWSGNFLKRLSSRYLEILGGLILIFLAIKSII